jgi:hypothetical protein
MMPNWPKELRELRMLVKQAEEHLLENNSVRGYRILELVDGNLSRLESWPGLKRRPARARKKEAGR